MIQYDGLAAILARRHNRAISQISKNYFLSKLFYVQLELGREAMFCSKPIHRITYCRCGNSYYGHTVKLLFIRAVLIKTQR